MEKSEGQEFLISFDKSRIRHLKGVMVYFKISKMMTGVKLEDGETRGQKRRTDATTIQGAAEKSLEEKEQQLCSWEGRQLALGPLLRKPRCVIMRTLELICRLICAGTHIITSSGSFPFMPPTLKYAPPNLSTTQAEMGGHESYHVNQEGSEKEKGHNCGWPVTPG